jgi:hypothetical protein
MNGSHLAIGVAAAFVAVTALSRRGSQASNPEARAQHFQRLLDPVSGASEAERQFARKHIAKMKASAGSSLDPSGSHGIFLDNQRLRNLTTGKMHTRFDHIVDDLQLITGDPEKTTSISAGAMRYAIMPWLLAQGLDDRFWDDRFDLTHTGRTFIRRPNPVEREEIERRYKEESRRRSG